MLASAIRPITQAE
ncbi:uncharacterized protein FRV6_11744 [Fusarium oxysporum]|uniref:Uncharacterized protein n=1 Tax=Fusarium oxysporum TaxID=5507 RepID=A0A2H3TG84_FUSOX|nr:uncharacterized protein FRV6_11744 [Fusarium oxysporum]